jgi:hypothetical protein
MMQQQHQVGNNGTAMVGQQQQYEYMMNQRTPNSMNDQQQQYMNSPLTQQSPMQSPNYNSPVNPSHMSQRPYQQQQQTVQQSNQQNVSLFLVDIVVEKQ